MMNHQGGLGQYNSNENIQSEANHSESNEALEHVSSSSSHTGRIQSLPDSLHGPNFPPYHEHVNIVRSNDCSVSVVHRNLDLNAEYVENDHYTNQNVSAGLCPHPFEPDVPDDQSDSNLFDLMAIDNGSSYVVDEQGVGSSSVDMSFLSCNRSPDHASRELLIGETSRAAEQGRVSTSQAAPVQANASNSLDILAPYIDSANIRQQFDTELRHETTRPVSSMQQLNEATHSSANSSPVSFEAGTDHGINRPVYDMLHFSHGRQTGCFQSNNQIDASPLAFAASSNLSMEHAMNTPVQLHRQTPQYHLQDHPYFYSLAQASVGAIPYVQPFVQLPNSHETLQPSPSVDVMGPRIVAPPFSPFYAVPGIGNPNNIPRNVMLGSQTARVARPPYPANLSFDIRTANFLGNFASPSHYGHFSGSHFSNAPTGAPWFNAFEQHMHMSLGVGNHPAAASTGFTGRSRNNPLDLNPPASSRQRESNKYWMI